MPTKPICPPCTGNCNQGLNCPALPEWPARRPLFVASQKPSSAIKGAHKVDLEHEPRRAEPAPAAEEPGPIPGWVWYVLGVAGLALLFLAPFAFGVLYRHYH